MTTGPPTVPAALFEDRFTVNPFAGAIPLIVTVPVEEAPPITEDGLNATDTRTGGLTVSAAVAVPTGAVPVIVTFVGEATAKVVTVNVVDVDPAGTDTLATTVAAFVLLELSVTVVPLVGAGPLRVTVPVEETPPLTVAGLSDTDVSDTAVTFRVAEAFAAPVAAVIDAVPLPACGIEVTVNVAELFPADTATLAGTVATLVLPEDNVTVIAPPAGPDSVTVPVEDVPPITVAGFSVTDCTTGLLTLSVTGLVLVPTVAVIVEVAFAASNSVVTVKVAVVAPALTVTEAGTVAAFTFDEESVTAWPLVGAGLASVTVPVTV